MLLLTKIASDIKQFVQNSHKCYFSLGCSDEEASDENQKTSEEVDKMMDANVEERHKQHLEFAQRYQKVIDDAQTSGVIRNIWPDENLKKKCGEVEEETSKSISLLINV